MNLKEIKDDLRDESWKYPVDYCDAAIGWLINRIEELEREVKKEKSRLENLLERMR